MNNDIMDIIYEELGVQQNDEYLNEFTIGSIKKLKDLTQKLKDKSKELNDVKDSDLTEYSDPKKVKNYLDKSSKIIDKTASDIESIRGEAKKSNLKMTIRSLIELGVLCLSSILAGPIGIIITSIVIIVDSVNAMVKMIKFNEKDIEIQNDLSKLKGVLRKLQNNKKLKESDKEKISACINKIEDAQKTTDAYVVRTTSEASIEELYEEYVATDKDIIDESFDNYDPWEGLN